jgi:hypothetical protein
MDTIALAQTLLDLLAWPLWGAALAGVAVLVRDCWRTLR